MLVGVDQGEYVVNVVSENSTVDRICNNVVELG